MNAQCLQQTSDSLLPALLADCYEKHVKIMPSLSLRQFQRLMKEELGVTVPLDLCTNGRKKAVRQLYADAKIEYARLWDYIEEVKVKNPGSSVDLVVDRGPNGLEKFKRLYICFNACKEGFVDGCRRIIGVDGCFLKGVVQGELLVAVGRDGNNQMFPIAWAQVEEENNDTWSWFLEHLKTDLRMGDGIDWAIISDQQKGLIRRP